MSWLVQQVSNSSISRDPERSTSGFFFVTARYHRGRSSAVSISKPRNKWRPFNKSAISSACTLQLFLWSLSCIAHPKMIHVGGPAKLPSNLWGVYPHVCNSTLLFNLSIIAKGRHSSTWQQWGGGGGGGGREGGSAVCNLRWLRGLFKPGSAAPNLMVKFLKKGPVI